VSRRPISRHLPKVWSEQTEAGSHQKALRAWNGRSGLDAPTDHSIFELVKTRFQRPLQAQ
jgi:hypothetical protein